MPDPGKFFRAESASPPLLRWQRYLRDEVLKAVSAHVIVLLDDADVLLSLSFSRADFLGALKAMRDARSDDPEVRRMTFCLFSVAGPTELSDDPRRSPFFASQTFALPDFTPEEARAFLPGVRSRTPQVFLDAVLLWTAGHPALTQRICQVLSRRPPTPEGTDEPDEKEVIDGLVQDLYFSSGTGGTHGPYSQHGGQGRLGRTPAALGIADPVLQDIERRFGKDNPRGAAMLSIYRRLCEGQRVGVLPESQAQLLLRESGLLVERCDGEGTHLFIRNRIFARVFSESWVKERLGQTALCAPLLRYREHDQRAEFLLSGDDLSEAVRASRGRDDLSVEERDFLFASQQAALEAERRNTEEQSVKRSFRLAEEQARRRRFMGLLVGAFLSVIVGLLGTIGWLFHDASQARMARTQADTARGESEKTQQSLSGETAKEKQDHGRTRAQLAETEGDLKDARKGMEEARRQIGQGEARSGVVAGRVEKIFKKRIITSKGRGAGPDTGVNKELVDGVLLKKGWPAIRGCYPIAGPVPRTLPVEVVVQQNGEISEAGAEVDVPQKECVLGVLRGLRFPPFSGAHFVRINYRFLHQAKK